MWAVIPAALGVPAKEQHALNAHSGPKKALRWYHFMESNFGDALNKELSQCVGNATWKKEYAVETTMDKEEEGKLLVIGSVMDQALRKWDYVLGAGLESNCPVKNHWADGTPLHAGFSAWLFDPDRRYRGNAISGGGTKTHRRVWLESC